MTQKTPAPQGDDLFPDLRGEPVRSFIETGWGRFPIALDDAGLNVNAFAVYVRISISSDSREEIDEAILSQKCRLSPVAVTEALKELQRRAMLEIKGENWTLTDPSEWLP